MGCGARDEQVVLSEACESDRHGGACLPVLELRLRSVCFGRGVCRERLALIRV